MSVEAKCPQCDAENIWGDCDECSSNDWKGHFSGGFFVNFRPGFLVSVECRKCGNIEYPPIQCVQCDKNINAQFFKDNSLSGLFLKYAGYLLIGMVVFILASAFA